MFYQCGSSVRCEQFYAGALSIPKRSPIETLTRPIVAKLHHPDEKQCVQCGIALMIYKVLASWSCFQHDWSDKSSEASPGIWACLCQDFQQTASPIWIAKLTMKLEWRWSWLIFVIIKFSLLIYLEKYVCKYNNYLKLNYIQWRTNTYYHITFWMCLDVDLH